MTEPRLVLLLAWKIAEILSKSRPGDDCTPFAQDVILEVAAWLRKRNVRVRASVEIAGDLEREINQAQPEPEEPTDEPLGDLIDKWAQEAFRKKPYGCKHPTHTYVACKAFEHGRNHAARAYLAQPEPEGPTDEELRRRFLTWWREEASAMRPHPDHDHEEHARRISEIAWANGAHVARWGRPPSTANHSANPTH